MSTAVADEAIGNIRTVKAFAMEDKELRYGSVRVWEYGGMGVRGYIFAWSYVLLYSYLAFFLSLSLVCTKNLINHAISIEG